MEEITNFVDSVEIYLKVEDPSYTKRISYWKKQRDYAQLIIDKNWMPTPKQKAIINSNAEALRLLFSKVIK